MTNPTTDHLHRIPKSGERLSGMTRQQCYILLQQGKLTGVRIGETTFITDASLRALPETLDPYFPRTSLAATRLVEARRRKRAAEIA